MQRKDRAPLKHDGTSAADPLLAAVLRAGQSELLAQHFNQTIPRLYRKLVPFAINADLDDLRANLMRNLRFGHGFSLLCRFDLTTRIPGSTRQHPSQIDADVVDDVTLGKAVMRKRIYLFDCRSDSRSYAGVVESCSG